MTIYLSNICIQMTDSLLPFELLYDNDWFRISSRVLYILAFTHLHILSCSCEVLLINGQANSSRMEKRGREYFCQKFSNLKIRIKQHKRILLNEGIYRMNISDLINKNRPYILEKIMKHHTYL